MEFILTNKEWIFSGIGVAILTLLLSFILKKRKTQRITNKAKLKNIENSIIKQQGEGGILDAKNLKSSKIVQDGGRIVSLNKVKKKS